MIANIRIRRAVAATALGCLGFFGLFDEADCFGESEWAALLADPSAGYEGWGYTADAGAYDGGGGESYVYQGVGGGIGGDGETFYFIDGDSSYISGP